MLIEKLFFDILDNILDIFHTFYWNFLLHKIKTANIY